MPRRIQAPQLGKYRVVCPYCDKQWVTEVNSNPHEIQCDCGKKTNILIATVRGKHSRKFSFYREYHVRVVLREGEKEISFEDSQDVDIPMRSSDTVIFYYLPDARRIIVAVQNVTISKFWNICVSCARFNCIGGAELWKELQRKYGVLYHYSLASILALVEGDAELEKWVDRQFVKEFDI